MDYARLKLLNVLLDAGVESTVATNFEGLEGQLGGIQLLVTYTAGPLPSDEQAAELESWLHNGGRWIALHGSCGGKAAKPREGERARRMMRMPFHDVLGSSFLNHPPQRRITLHSHADAGGSAAALLAGVPQQFDCEDEPYLVELTVPHDDPSMAVFMTFECTDEEARPGGVAGGAGFLYDDHPALDDGGTTLAVGYERTVGRGGVVYCALGHW